MGMGSRQLNELMMVSLV